MPDILVTFTKDPDSSVTSYNVLFTTTPSGSTTPNAPLTLNILQSASGDASGYTCKYSQLSPTPPVLNAGDSVAITAQSGSPTEVSPFITASGSPIVVPATPPPALVGPQGLTAVYTS